ncbi:MFS transporter [uncultured Oscillibacter sp.]|uniref:MFS transporter n=1 Tax=uncultured Oscillibacter sp. TaxID=876091 RepID=UPI0026348A6B|nr:MFS transporter [uncultured Oscillibacter sp.]
MAVRKERGKVLPVICGTMFFLGFQVGGLQLTVAQISAELALDEAQAGALISMQYACMIVIPLAVGALSDRVGKKAMLLAAQILYCLGCIGVCAGTSFHELTGAVLLTGAGYGSAQAASSAALADRYGDSSYKYQNLSQCMFSLSAFLSPIITHNTGLPWRAVFGIAGIGVFVCAAVLLAERGRDWKEHAGGGGLIWPEAGRLLGRLWLPMLCMMLCVGLENGITYFSSLLFAQRNWDSAYTACALSAFWISVTVMRLVVSRLDISPLKAVGRMQLCLGVVLLLICRVNTPFSAIVLFGAAGGCLSILGPSLIGQAAAACPAHTGIASSLMISASGVGSVVMPVLMGRLASTLNMEASYLSIAVLAFCGSLLAGAARRSAD